MLLVSTLVHQELSGETEVAKQELMVQIVTRICGPT